MKSVRVVRPLERFRIHRHELNITAASPYRNHDLLVAPFMILY